ncbi:hypothetical protein ACHAPA_009385 [Fusarium lateritium]
MVNLIDTPGFDDDSRTDTEVLRQITLWLTETYRKKIQLSGIIYVHQITAVRMQGSARKNLALFKALCGPDALKNVILVTSMWDNIDEPTGIARETELRTKQKYWGWMCEKGSTVLRHYNTRDSAMNIIERFVPKPTVVLQIQHDLVDLGKSFEATDAGVEVNREKAEADAKAEAKLDDLEKEWKQAFKQKDQEYMNYITELRAETQAERQERDENYRQLQMTMDQIQQEQRRYRELELHLQASENNHRMEIHHLRNQLEQQSLLQHPPAWRPQRQLQEYPTQDPNTMQRPRQAHRERPKHTQEAATVPVPAAVPAPIPAPIPPPQPAQARPPTQSRPLVDEATVMCTIKYKTKLSHWMGSKAPKEIVFKMCRAEGKEGFMEYPMPKRGEEFLNLLQREVSGRMTKAIWYVKDDVYWTPETWFPKSEYVSRDSSDRVWTSFFNGG